MIWTKVQDVWKVAMRFRSACIGWGLLPPLIQIQIAPNEKVLPFVPHDGNTMLTAGGAAVKLRIVKQI